MTSEHEILVLGPTGNTGTALVETLSGAGSVPARTASRALDRPTRLPHTQFDWFDLDTHVGALGDAGRLYLVAPAGQDDPVAVVEPFLRRALESGVSRVVMLSSSAVEPGDAGLGLVDSLVRELFPEWAILRPSWFMQNFVGDHPLAHSIRAERSFVTATGSGRLGFIDARDIGRTASALLTADDLENGEYVLTGPESLSYSDAASLVAEAIGETVFHSALDSRAYVSLLTNAGYKEEFAAILAGLDERVRAGEQDLVTNTVETVTGAGPMSFTQFMDAHRQML